MTASDDTAGTMRRKVAGNALFGFAVLAVFAWVAIATAGILEKPGLEGILGGVFGGLFVALLIMAGGAWASSFCHQLGIVLGIDERTKRIG